MGSLARDRSLIRPVRMDSTGVIGLDSISDSALTAIDGSARCKVAVRYLRKRARSLSCASRESQATLPVAAAVMAHWARSVDLPKPAGDETIASLPAVAVSS